MYKYFPKVYKLKKIRNESYLKIFYKFNLKLRFLPNFPRNIQKIFNLEINNDYILGELGFIELKSGEIFCRNIAKEYHIRQFNFIKDLLKKKY